MVKIDKQTIIKIAIAAIVIFCVGMLAGYWICSRRNLSDNGAAANAVTNGLDTIGQQQSAAGTAINGAGTAISDAQGTADSITGDIGNAQESAITVADGLTNAQGTVDDLTNGIAASKNISTSSSDILARDIKILQEIRTNGKR